MNTIGRLFRTSIFGESHGNVIGMLIDGCPAGIKISENEFTVDLDRRKSGANGTTARKEADVPLVKSGLFKGKTTGAPICIMFENKNVDSAQYERLKDTPRPGHADMVAMQKFCGSNDYRGGGHFSGRLTAPLVAAGVVAKKIITPIKIEAKLIEIHGSKNEDGMEKEINNAIRDGESVGGIIECRVNGLPVGLGEPFFDSFESLLSHAIFSIPGIKGIEFGAGFGCAEMLGSEFNDEILTANGKTKTNNAGGINGGITNGNELVFRVAIRPTASISKEQKTINLKTGKQTGIKIEGRHDACIALRTPVIVEAVTAIVLADLKMLNDIALIERVRK
ncbi:chorismate synthase [Candidatus Micrarchaeota archaeon]|nr:chorismate synthase [Candidatus Micrarchaeota archaeon]MBU1166302.1 chorismate synthase [Candidatus Micrarchaeota archaeon]MBU1886388.1 chorismate synthase [Candidatus Micrarchaeota archaeon]